MGPVPHQLTVFPPKAAGKEILYNLTVNAIQASPARKGGHTVNRVDKESVEVSVPIGAWHSGGDSGSNFR